MKATFYDNNGFLTTMDAKKLSSVSNTIIHGRARLKVVVDGHVITCERIEFQK